MIFSMSEHKVIQISMLGFDGRKKWDGYNFAITLFILARVTLTPVYYIYRLAPSERIKPMPFPFKINFWIFLWIIHIVQVDYII